MVCEMSFLAFHSLGVVGFWAGMLIRPIVTVLLAVLTSSGVGHSRRNGIPREHKATIKCYRKLGTQQRGEENDD